MFYIQVGDLRAIEPFDYFRSIIRRLGVWLLVMPRLEHKLSEMARQLDH